MKAFFFAMAVCTLAVLSSFGSNPETIAHKHHEATDTLKHDTQRKGYLEPNDNQIDSVLTLPKELFAQTDCRVLFRELGNV